MPDTQQALQSGVQHHQAGDLDQAAGLYRQVIEQEPRNADAHHLLGLLCLQQNDLNAALDHLRTAIDCQPQAATFHFHLGTALSRTGQKLQALDAYRQAVQLDPQAAPIHTALGNLLRSLGQLDEAEAAYRQAAHAAPQSAEVQNDLGNVLQDQQRYEEATQAFQTALRLRPEAAEIYFNLGNCYRHRQLDDQAVEAYRQAVALRPELVLAHQHLGLTLQRLDQFEQAADCHRRAIELDPTMVEAHNALGVALQKSKQLDQAIASYQQALQQAPHHVTARFNLASALHAQGELQQAEAHYQAVIKNAPNHRESLTGLGQVYMLRGKTDEAWGLVEQTLANSPDSPDAHFFRGTMLLSRGELKEGFREFEYRFQRASSELETFDEPRWEGKPLDGKTLLVHAEYGYGDMLQFIRYAPMVQRRAQGRVLFEVHPMVIPLMEHSGYRELVPQYQPRQPFDVQMPMMCLPRLFETTLETIPADVPYLVAAPELVAKWKQRLAGVDRLRVGIHWQGNPKFAADHFRSIPLACFAPMAELPGVQLVSLQKGPGRAQLQDVPAGWSILDVADELTDFHETAALMKNLDLVITCDSSPGHLAGGLGVPVWIALSVSSDWRWMLHREDSPWYPSARLFRQPRLNDWNRVFERMAAELAAGGLRTDG